MPDESAPPEQAGTYSTSRSAAPSPPHSLEARFCPDCSLVDTCHPQVSSILDQQPSCSSPPSSSCPGVGLRVRGRCSGEWMLFSGKQGCKNFQVGPEPWANMCTCAVPSLFRTVLCFSKRCQSRACVHTVLWWESIKVLQKEVSSAVIWPDIEEVGGGKRSGLGEGGLWKVSGDSVSSIRSRSNDLSGWIFGLSSSWSYSEYHLSSLYQVQYCCLVK